MKIVEIRVLDGPNLFLPVPAIKIEFAQAEESDLDTLADAVRAVEEDVPEPVSADPPNRETGLVLRSRAPVIMPSPSPGTTVPSRRNWRSWRVTWPRGRVTPSTFPNESTRSVP